MKTFTTRYRSIAKLKDFIDQNSISDDKSLLIQMFTSMKQKSKIEKILLEIQKMLPSSILVGCSSDGEIYNGKILDGNTIVIFTQFNSSTIKAGMFEIEHDEREVGLNIANDLLENNSKVLLLFSTFLINGQSLIDACHEDRNSLVIAGALASDDGKFDTSVVFLGSNISESGVIAISLSGDNLIANNNYTHNWEPISRDFVVDSSKGNHLINIDGKMSKALYENYLDISPEDSLLYTSYEFPMVLNHKNTFISKMATQELPDGSLKLSSNIKNGDILQIAYADIDKIDRAIKELFESVSYNPTETLFVYSSSARRRFISPLAKREILSLSEYERFVKAYPM